jgi:hypothetical protein
MMPAQIRINVHHIMIGNSLLSLILQQLPKEGQRIQFACFVIRPSADAAVQEQQHTLWDVLQRAS